LQVPCLSGLCWPNMNGRIALKWATFLHALSRSRFVFFSLNLICLSDLNNYQHAILFGPDAAVSHRLRPKLIERVSPRWTFSPPQVYWPNGASRSMKSLCFLSTQQVNRILTLTLFRRPRLPGSPGQAGCFAVKWQCQSGSCSSLALARSGIVGHKYPAHEADSPR
jgi:hypothetical protein